MRLLHGSNRIIKEPQFGYGKKYNDYGLGFYCTENIEMANEWSVEADRDGIVNVYNLDLDNLTVLDLTNKDYNILEWLEILLENRTFDIQTDFGYESINYICENFKPEYETFDVIKGYRADDSYFSFAQDFLNNNISLNTLKKAMQLGGLGEQIVLKSQKSFENIQFVESINVESKIWFPRKEQRDKKARNDYRELRQKPWKKGEIYIMQILDMEIKRDDARLR